MTRLEIWLEAMCEVELLEQGDQVDNRSGFDVFLCYCLRTTHGQYVP
jgi:hypothetical protein